jgi:hypothetical protein
MTEVRETKRMGISSHFLHKTFLIKEAHRLIDQRCAFLPCYTKTFCGVLRTFI